MTGKRKRRRVSRPLRHAKLYKALGIPKKWIAVLNGYPRPLEVLQVMLAARSVAVSEEICDSVEGLTDAILELTGEGVGEVGELVTVQ